MAFHVFGGYGYPAGVTTLIPSAPRSDATGVIATGSVNPRAMPS